MTNSNFDYGKPPDRPDDKAFDALDEIDQAVAQITAADVEERLCETLRQAGYNAGPDLNAMFACPPSAVLSGKASGVPAPVQGEGSIEATVMYLVRAQIEARAARREADAILAAAREEADRALSEATKMIGDARQ